MLYNLRADIIYYKSGSDFELEFNLCGCCRMRLLTDKPSDKKLFVHSLARAVSRSRVILIAGPIFGDENTIDIVAQALGAQTEIVDNAAYGIASDEDITIIKGALPLVSNDGSFAGCIIESGPQTMILLTDNKALRKTIMSTLIHPYISELYTAELNGNKSAAEEDISEGEALDAAELYIPEGVQDISSSSQEPSGEINENELLSNDNSEEIPLILSVDESGTNNDITEEDIYIDTPESIAEQYEPIKDIKIEDLFPATQGFAEAARTLDEKIDEANIIMDNDEYVASELPENYHTAFNNLFTDEDTSKEGPIINEEELNTYNLYDDSSKDDEEEEIIPKRKSKLNIIAIIFTVILLLAIGVLCYLIFTVSDAEGLSPMDYVKEVWQTVF